MELKIEKSAAVKAYEDADKKGKKLLENILGKNVFVKNIRERIQTIHDVFELNGTTEKEFEAKWKGFEAHEKGEAFEKLMVAAYNNNEGKLPDMTDGTPKYCLWFTMGSPSGVCFAYFVFDDWRAYSSVGARLLFYGPDAKANALDSKDKFLEQYKQSRTT